MKPRRTCAWGLLAVIVSHNTSAAEFKFREAVIPVAKVPRWQSFSSLAKPAGLV